MQSSAEGDPPRPGLRERKKAKTRALIQEHALRLFKEQGFDETTVEEIAEAAEVSPSTFFRYFPSKEDVVLYDPLDPLLIDAFRRQPPEMTPIEALRTAMAEAMRDPDVDWMKQQRERAQLVFSVPTVRMRMFEEFVSSMAPFTEVLAERTGREPDDFEVRNLVGAILGVSIAAWLAGAETPDVDYFGLMDRALQHLDAGLPT